MYEYIARFCHRNRTDLMRGILDFVPLMRYHLEFAFQRLNCFSVTVIFSLYLSILDHLRILLSLFLTRCYGV